MCRLWSFEEIKHEINAGSRTWGRRRFVLPGLEQQESGTHAGLTAAFWAGNTTAAAEPVRKQRAAGESYAEQEVHRAGEQTQGARSGATRWPGSTQLGSHTFKSWAVRGLTLSLSLSLSLSPTPSPSLSISLSPCVSLSLSLSLSSLSLSLSL